MAVSAASSRVTPSICPDRPMLRTASIAAGAVGDIMGTFLDSWGKPVKHAVNRRVIAAPVEMLRDIATSIVASGGLNKTAILAGVLRAKLCSVLVVDEAAARAVLGILRGTG